VPIRVEVYRHAGGVNIMTQLQSLQEALETIRRHPKHYGPWWEMYFGILIEMRKQKEPA
jgi:hypothetical protein